MKKKKKIPGKGREKQEVVWALGSVDMGGTILEKKHISETNEMFLRMAKCESLLSFLVS